MKTLQEQMQELLAENARLRALAEKPTPAPRKPTFKVSPKGAVSVYGMGRFPVTLYAGQWETLLACQEDLKKFIQGNAQALQDKRA